MEDSDRDDHRRDQATSVILDTSGLYGLLNHAVQHNPGVEAAFNRWKAAVERIPQVTTLPDPRLSFGHYLENVETRAGPQKQSFGLSQLFPWFGTLRLKGDIAVQDALIAQQRFEAIRDRLHLEVASAYAEYYYLARSTAITKGLFEILGVAEPVAQSKYRAGTGSYSNVIQAQVELGRLEDRLYELAAREQSVVARLNAVLDRPLDAALPAPDTLPLESLELSDSELLERAKGINPTLRSLDLAVERESRAIDLAKRKFYPNLTIGIDYLNTGASRAPGTLDSGKDAIIGRLSLNIPIWRGAYRAGQREAEARRRATELERRDRENLILSQIHSVLFAFHDTERKISLYRNALIPKAQQAVNASLQAYKTGEVDFLDFLDAQRMLLEFELAYDRARADHVIRLAELRMLAGSAYDETAGDQR